VILGVAIDLAILLGVQLFAARLFGRSLFGTPSLLQAPLTLQVLEGDPQRVAPGHPVAAVAFLPLDFDLRRPLTLRWAGVSGSWTLRR